MERDSFRPWENRNRDRLRHNKRISQVDNRNAGDDKKGEIFSGKIHTM